MVAAFNVIQRIGKLGEGNPDWAHIGIVFQVKSSQCNCVYMESVKKFEQGHEPIGSQVVPWGNPPNSL